MSWEPGLVCSVCGKRILRIMRGAGCCLGPFVR
jgi:hypothetical protein